MEGVSQSSQSMQNANPIFLRCDGKVVWTGMVDFPLRPCIYVSLCIRHQNDRVMLNVKLYLNCKCKPWKFDTYHAKMRDTNDNQHQRCLTICLRQIRLLPDIVFISLSSFHYCYSFSVHWWWMNTFPCCLTSLTFPQYTKFLILQYISSSVSSLLSWPLGHMFLMLSLKY